MAVIAVLKKEGGLRSRQTCAPGGRSFAGRIFRALRRGRFHPGRHGAAAEDSRPGDAVRRAGGRGRHDRPDRRRHRNRRSGGRRKRAGGGVCVVANDNAPGQVVISGSQGGDGPRAATSPRPRASSAPFRLSVSAPFHCPLMQPAADAMPRPWPRSPSARRPCRCWPMSRPTKASEPDTIRRLLVEQVTGRVRWRESMLALRERWAWTRPSKWAATRF